MVAFPRMIEYKAATRCYAKGYAGMQNRFQPCPDGKRRLSEISIWAYDYYDIDTCLFQVRNLMQGACKVRVCFNHAASCLAKQ